MDRAIELARKAGKRGDVPVGAVIVKGNKIIATAFNTKTRSHCTINHAEIIAINRACKKLKDFRLNGCDMYVTFEPCVMCYGALLSARLDNVYFGAYDRRFGTVDVLKDIPFNHKINFVGGVKEQECSLLLTQFFDKLRRQ